MKANDNEILTIAGKRVRVAYCKPGEDCCSRCCFSFGGGETCVGIGDGEEWPCEKFDLATAYFVEAEQPISIGTDTWFQQLKVGDKVETYDGRIETIRKKYEDSFMLGFDAEGRENCAPDGYFPIAISECRPFVDQSSSIAPEADVNKWAVTNAFLHCEKAGKIVSEMYGDKFNNQRNRDKYLAFLAQVNLDDRFGELAEILQRCGAMHAPKEQPEADLEAEIERWWNERYAKLKKDYKFDSTSGHYIDNEGIIDLARHFAEWGAEHLKK